MASSGHRLPVVVREGRLYSLAHSELYVVPPSRPTSGRLVVVVVVVGVSAVYSGAIYRLFNAFHPKQATAAAVKDLLRVLVSAIITLPPFHPSVGHSPLGINQLN